jgi:hypothetical protein
MIVNNKNAFDLSFVDIHGTLWNQGSKCELTNYILCIVDSTDSKLVIFLCNTFNKVIKLGSIYF